MRLFINPKYMVCHLPLTSQHTRVRLDRKRMSPEMVSSSSSSHPSEGDDNDFDGDDTMDREEEDDNGDNGDAHMEDPNLSDSESHHGEGGQDVNHSQPPYQDRNFWRSNFDS